MRRCSPPLPCCRKCVTCAHLLRPYMLVSIYGHHLGPDSGCTPCRGTYPDPVELCGVGVTIGGRKAGLLYVQEQQINLSVPSMAPAEGMVDFVVTYNGFSSAPVPIRFAPLTARIRLTGPAYVNMSVWIEVDFPSRRGTLSAIRSRSILPISAGTSSKCAETVSTFRLSRRRTRFPRSGGRSRWARHGSEKAACLAFRTSRRTGPASHYT